MRNITKYTLICGCILALSACSEKLVPVGPETLEAEIGFAAGAPATKGFIESQEAFDVAATEIKVYDFVTGSDGEDGTAEAMYIDDSIHGVIATDGTWAYSAENTHYHWTKKGTHKFFGWLTKAPDGTAFATGQTPSFDADTKTLSVPALTMTKDTPQFDFVYSDIVTREAADPEQHGPIDLQMSHLFSAIALKLTNESDDNITVTSVELTGFKARKSATINYSADTAPEPAYTTASDSPSLPLTVPSATLSPDSSFDLLTGNAAGTDPHFIMMWPQTVGEIAQTGFAINYTIAGDYQEDGVTLTPHQKTVAFTDTDIFNEMVNGSSTLTGMKAGKKYALEFIFKGKTIDLRLVVLPWDYNEYAYDYSEASIDSGPEGVGEMDFNQVYAGYNRSARTVTLQNQSDVLTGNFQIYAPHTGNWALSVYGSGVDYFTVSPMEGEINVDQTVGKQVVEFTVTPSTTAPPATVELHFNVAIRLNGEWVDANSEFNRKDWKIVWER